MKTIPNLFVLFMGLFVSSSAASIRVLIVDGFSHHDGKQTTAMIRGIIELTRLFEVAVSTTQGA